MKNKSLSVCKLIGYLGLVITSQIASANELKFDPAGPSLDQVTAAKDQISRFVLSMKDIHGIGVTACENTTGLGFFKLDHETLSSKLFVNCIEVYASTQEALAAFRTLYPEGTKAKLLGIFIDSRLL